MTTTTAMANKQTNKKKYEPNTHVDIMEYQSSSNETDRKSAKGSEREAIQRAEVRSGSSIKKLSKRELSLCVLIYLIV